jgi:hypothetical protein
MNSNNFQVTDIFSQSLFIMAGFCFLLVVLSYFRGENSRGSLKEAIAKVSEVRSETIQVKDEKGELKEHGPTRIVYVKFETSAGKTISARLKDIRGSEVTNYPVGLTIPIQHNPEFPDQIWETSVFDQHGLELIVGAFGVVFLFSAFLATGLSKVLVFPVSKTQMFFPKVCVIFGLVFVGISIWNFYIQNNPSGFITTTATVTGYDLVKSNSAHYPDETYPVLQFQASDGRTITVRSQSQINHAHDRLGARYQVAYSTTDPVSARPVTSDGPIAGSVFLFFIGLFPLSIGGIWLMHLLRHQALP